MKRWICYTMAKELFIYRLICEWVNACIAVCGLVRWLEATFTRPFTLYLINCCIFIQCKLFFFWQNVRIHPVAHSWQMNQSTTQNHAEQMYVTKGAETNLNIRVPFTWSIYLLMYKCNCRETATTSDKLKCYSHELCVCMHFEWANERTMRKTRE